MRIIAISAVLGAALGFASLETSLLAMIASVAIMVLASLLTRPRFAVAAGGLLGIGGLWLVTSSISFIRCQSSGADCSNVLPFGAIAAALVLVGVLLSIATLRARQIP